MRVFFLTFYWAVFLFFSLLVIGALPSFLSAFTDPRAFGLGDMIFFFGSFIGQMVAGIALQTHYHAKPIKRRRLTAPREIPAFPSVGQDAPAGVYMTPIGKQIWHPGGLVKQLQWDAIDADARSI